MIPGGEPIPLGREHPWRRTIAATSFLLGFVAGCLVAMLAMFLTEA